MLTFLGTIIVLLFGGFLYAWLMLFSCYVTDSSNQNALTTAEDGDYSDHPQSSGHTPENLSGDGDVSSSIPEYNENKQANALPFGGHPYSVVHTPPNYNIGPVPPILAPLENPESQAREVSRLSSFVVSISLHPPCFSFINAALLFSLYCSSLSFF